MLVEIFQSQPTWWADQSTDAAFHRAMLLASLKIKQNISGNTICWGRLCETIESSRTATERCGDIDFGLTDRAGTLESIETRTSTLQDFRRFVASLLLQHTRWFVLWLCMFSITVRDTNTWGKPEEAFHQHKNIRAKSPRERISFQNKGDSGGSSSLEAVLWLEGCHIPSTTSNQSNE